MGKTKTHAFKGRLYCEIPQDIVKQLGLEAGDEVEFKHAHEKVALIVPSKKAEKKPLVTEASILEKLTALSHPDRTKDKVEKILTKEEKEVFEKMKKKKIFFDYIKKGKKLIGITKKYYKAPKASSPKSSSFPAAAAIEKNEMIDKLQREGCLVLDNIGTLTGDLRKRGLEKRVIGIRGFDKKFYIILNQRLLELEGKIMKSTQKKRKVEDLAKELNISEPLCRAALEILREDGRVIEKANNEYVAA